MLRAKFLNDHIEKFYPAVVSPESVIMNQSMASMLCMTSKAYENVDMFPLLYSSELHGKGWHCLVDNIRYYDGPIIILVRHLVNFDIIDEFLQKEASDNV